MVADTQSRKHKHHAKKRVKDMKKSNGSGLIAIADSLSPITEQYRTIRSNIQFSMVDRELKTLGITSAEASEGKSTVSSNLAVVFAQSGMKVLLVDADLRKPTMHKVMHLENNQGLSTFLVDRSESWRDGLHTFIGTSNLTIMTSGPKPPNPSELLGSKRMRELMMELEEEFDLVIFDLPPIVTVTDAQIMLSQTDGCVLVAHENVTNKNALLRAKELLTMSEANVLGAVYTGVERTKGGYYHYKYY